jgi:membrane glycosyltransferase
MALYRMAVWVMGDVWWLGELPRIEAALFLLIALAFVWLRPTRAASEAS